MEIALATIYSKKFVGDGSVGGGGGVEAKSLFFFVALYCCCCYCCLFCRWAPPVFSSCHWELAVSR